MDYAHNCVVWTQKIKYIRALKQGFPNGGLRVDEKLIINYIECKITVKMPMCR